MLNIPTKYIRTETGWGLLAVTVALSGAAIIPRWSSLVEYCVPRTQCRIVKAVDPELFLWHQKTAATTAEKLRQRARAIAKHKKKNFDYDQTLGNIDNTLGDASADFGEFAVGVQHTFAPKSSKEFLRLTAEARRKGWQLEPVQELPGYSDWRKVAGALSFISVAGTAWTVGQLEILQQKRDRRSELDEEFDLQQHRKALEGEATVIHAEIDWVSATEQKALEAEYLGDDYVFGLGNYSMDDDGTVNDSYGVLDNIFINQFLIPDEETRKELRGEYQRLKSTSRSNNRPILFCSLDPMSVVLMPDLRHYENHKLSVSIPPQEQEDKKDSIIDISLAESPLLSPNPSIDIPELMSAMIKSFSGKGLVKINRIPSGCNRVRTVLAEYKGERLEQMLHMIVDALVREEKAIKHSKATSIGDHVPMHPDDEFEIV